jgi:hypothetical protein
VKERVEVKEREKEKSTAKHWVGGRQSLRNEGGRLVVVVQYRTVLHCSSGGGGDEMP